MPYADLRKFLNRLEACGKLCRIANPVDKDWAVSFRYQPHRDTQIIQGRGATADQSGGTLKRAIAASSKK